MMDTIRFTWMFVIPLVFSPLVYLLGRLELMYSSKHSGQPLLRLLSVRAWAFLALLASWVPYLLALKEFSAGTHLEFAVEAVWLRADAISLLLAGMVLTLGTLVVLFSGPYMRDEVGEEKFYAMLLAMMGLMIGLGCAGDLFNLWVWFEGMAISSYLLVAFYREQPASLEAGMKYLVQSAVGSVLVLLGIALVLANSGSLDLAALQTNQTGWLVEHRLVALAAAGLFIIGFGVKVALVPLHSWLPDAHSQAPSGISAMLSGVVIEAGLIAMLRALGAVALPLDWRMLFLIFGGINMLFGNLMAFRQGMVKRLLAYSSLAHVGYILLGLGVALYPGGSAGAQGAMFHLVTHMLMKGLAFLAVGALIYAIHLRNGRHDPLLVSELDGASQKYPLVTLALAIALLGLGGLPPLAGFMSKWQIFAGGFGTGNGWLMVLMVFMALNSVLSLGYYAPLVSRMYRRQACERVLAGKDLPWQIILPLIILSLLVLLLGFAPGVLDVLTVPAGARFVELFGSMP
jgi:proton-translocating NADH-quinone oxidoreductase chain N